MAAHCEVKLMQEVKYQLTKERYEAFQEERRHLIKVERPLILKEIEESRGYGDLSENADYDAARTRQGKIEGRILEIEHILNNAEIIEFSKNSKEVSLGNYVKLEDLEFKETMILRLVGQFEGKPLDGVITLDSPIAQAIIGRRVGDKVIVNAKTPYEVVIVQISTKPIN